MLKLGDSVLGKCALEIGPWLRMWLDILCLVLKRSGIESWDLLNHLSRNQEKRESYPGTICKRALFSKCVNRHDIYGRSTKFLRMLYQQNVSAWPERGRDRRTSEKAVRLPKFYRQKNRII